MQAVMKQKSCLMLGLMYLSIIECPKHDWHAAFGHKRLCYMRATAGTFILNLLYTTSAPLTDAKVSGNQYFAKDRESLSGWSRKFLFARDALVVFCLWQNFRRISIVNKKCFQLQNEQPEVFDINKANKYRNNLNYKSHPFRISLCFKRSAILCWAGIEPVRAEA